MPSQSRVIRDELRVSLEEVCEAMRAHKRAIDRTVAEFKRCSQQTRKSLDASEETLARLRHNSPTGGRR